MKLLKSLVLVVAAGLIMTACGGGGATPSEVAKKVMDATLKFDFNEVKKYVAKDIVPLVEQSIAQTETEEGKQMLEMYKNLVKDVKVEVVSEEIAEDGNTAKVTLKTTSPTGEVSEDTINLVKEEDGWKVKELPNAGGK
ncbi:MAG: DUF4878 domain-containing protein [Prevotellaceae bacterium]|jgi:ABC-type glycerol-3-phosphate transport system substrate-binding protein|nr:DUF4878 domain-containing protein [Prevotellaceae bacterium]